MTAPLVSTWLIAVIVFFVVFLVITAGAQLWAAFMDRRRGQEIESDTQRAHPHGEDDLHGPRED
jgi:hypothetical protein